MSTLRAVDLIRTAAENIDGLSFLTGTRLLANIEADNISLPVCILDRPIRIPVTVAAGGRMIEQFECTVFFFNKSELEYQFEFHEPIVGAMKLNADQFIVNLNSFSDYVLNIGSVVYTDLINALDSNLTGVQVTFTMDLIPEAEQVCPTGSFTPEGLPTFSKYLTEVIHDDTLDGKGTTESPLTVIGGGGGGSNLRVQDEGTTVTNAATTINFTGAGVTASLASAGNVTVNIPAASGGAVDSVNGQTGTVVLDTDDISDTATNRYTNDTDIARLANTSGTNTGDQDLSGLALKTTTISTQSPLSGGGDLSANRTLSIPQANGSTDGYLDSADWNTFNGKQDPVSAGTGISIASDVITNTAPDQTVVLTAGTGIGVSGIYPNFTIENTKPASLIYKDTANQTAVTGVTTNTKVISVLIPANTVTVGSIIEIKARMTKPAGNGLMVLRVYANTADSIVSPAPTLLTTSTSQNVNNNYTGIDRTAIVKSSTVTQTASAVSSVLTDASAFQGVVTNSNIDWTVPQYLIFAIQNASAADATTLSYYQIEIK